MFQIICSFLILMILILVFIFYRSKSSFKKKLFEFTQYNSEIKTEKLNPDINTLDWDLHKTRLQKFGRSQYKGLTFFINERGTIYYLNEKGIRVYC